MPIYEYVCDTCGKEIEVIQKFSDAPLTRCTCSKNARLKRKLSATAFHLQGGGWYNEGYSAKKNDDTPKTGSAGKSSDPPAAKSDASGSKSESKTDASGSKSESKSGSGSKSESKSGSGSKSGASGSKGSSAATA